VEIGQRLDGLAGTRGGQSQAQAKRRDDALSATKLHLCATGVEQGFGKHPLELVSNHATVPDSKEWNEILKLFPLLV
jgi:hypothetical protein